MGADKKNIYSTINYSALGSGFQVGEIVTVRNATPANIATGYIAFNESTGTTGTMVIIEQTGTLTGASTLIGNITGATANVDSTVALQKRQDLNDIFEAVKRRCSRALRPLKDIDPDDFMISENEHEDLFDFAMSGATEIADHTHMVKYQSQTGLDALTYYVDLEDPDGIDDELGDEAVSYSDPDTDTDGDETIVDPDGQTIEIEDINTLKIFLMGEKLVISQDTIELQNLEDPRDPSASPSFVRNRYTIVQNYIKEAMISYILYRWWDMVGMDNFAQKEYRHYIEARDNVRYNSVRNHEERKTRIPQRPLYG